MNYYSALINNFRGLVRETHYLKSDRLYEDLLGILNDAIHSGIISDGWIECSEFYYEREWRIFMRETSSEKYYNEYTYKQKLGEKEC